MTTEFFVLRRSVTTCSIMTWVDTHGGTMSHNVYVELTTMKKGLRNVCQSRRQCSVTLVTTCLKALAAI